MEPERTDAKRLKKLLNGFRHSVMTWLYLVDKGKMDAHTAEKMIFEELLPEIEIEVRKVFRIRK